MIWYGSLIVYRIDSVVCKKIVPVTIVGAEEIQDSVKWFLVDYASYINTAQIVLVDDSHKNALVYF